MALDDPKKQITVKDIAQIASVSTGTVHRALHGKKGVSDELKAHILKIAKDIGYIPNEAAAALKRRKQRVLIAAPGPKASNRFFYTYIWKGFTDYIEELRCASIEAVQLPYYNIVGNSMAEELDSAYSRYQSQIDGILVSGYLDERNRAKLKEYHQKGIPIAIATDQLDEALVSVQADFTQTGALAAELLSSQLPAGSKVLVDAGGVNIRAHFLMAQGFEEYLKANNTEINYVFVHGYGEEREPFVRRRVEELLDTDPSIRAMFSVNARGSVLLSEIVRKRGCAGQIRLVGNDLFDENIQSMKDGVMQNIIFKSPYEQAREAAKALFEYMLYNKKPIRSNITVQSNVIFNSNLHLYC